MIHTFYVTLHSYLLTLESSNVYLNLLFIEIDSKDSEITIMGNRVCTVSVVIVL